MGQLLYEGLFALNERFEPEPVLADAYTYDSESRTWTITLRSGVMFSDADLLGCPVRVFVSPRNLAEGCCEVMTRTKSINEKVAVDDVIPQVKKMIKDMFDELNK